jgi:hypothetical protein
MQSRIAVEAIIEHSNIITFAGTCDLALWCKLLRDKGWTGPRIARALGRSEGYVNNLIRVVDRASPKVMMRWREEQHDPANGVCATDWLVQICLVPHAEQDAELERRLATLATALPTPAPSTNTNATG